MVLSNQISDIIKTEARSLGFIKCGITIPGTPPSFDVYQDWISKGFHGTMHYLERSDLVSKRKQPNLLFPSAKSIISLAYPYQPPSDVNPELGLPLYGRIASFALSPDYHEILSGKAELLCQRIFQEVNSKFGYKICVDTSPILERAFAVNSGIGWIGKNSNLITPELGSFVLLCEIMLDIVLPPSHPFTQDYCGNCNRCIEACPTHCIQKNRTIAATNCISYLTIEHQGFISPDVRDKMGNWIFGCDICQIVCPWNKKHIQLGTTVPPKDNIIPSKLFLSDALKLDQESFKMNFNNTTFLRTKYESFIRNLIIAAGNSGNGIFRDPLNRLKKNQKLQEYACWAIEKITQKK